MTRAERRERSARRRLEIKLLLADKLQDLLAEGLGVRPALEALDKWASAQVQRVPQERNLWESAVGEWCDDMAKELQR